MAEIQPINIRFEDVTYEVKDGFHGPKKKILINLNGYFKSGELTGIMGPSGAGKSTLLNVLSGFEEGTSTGTVEYIGSAGKQDWKKYKRQLCYIQQNDSLYSFFTVRESMKIAAYLKIDNSVSGTFKELLIDNILDTLNLSSTKDTRVERLSGGQRKRLSIALELIDNPPVMFLDEPITGLDSTASVQCITALQILAKAGRTVICTIHQPSATIYHMLDHIYLLSNGHCMYANTPDNTVHYFGQQGLQCPNYHNPADYILEVVSHEYGVFDDHLIKSAKQYCQRNETPLKLPVIKEARDNRNTCVSINPPSEMTRFWILLHRCVLLLYRDRITTQLKLILHFLVGIVIGLMYENSGRDASKVISNINLLQVVLVYFAYTSMIPAVLKFPLELPILKKEHFNNWYRLKTYYVAFLISSIPLQIISAIILSSIVYLLTSQPLEWFRFLMFLLMVILIIVSSETMGLGLGTILSPVNGVFFGSIILCVMTILGGFLAFFKDMPIVIYYTSYLNTIRYGFDGLMQSLYGFNREKFHCPINMEYCHFRMPKTILEELSINTMSYWTDAVALFGFFVIFRIIVYISLKRSLSKPR